MSHLFRFQPALRFTVFLLAVTAILSHLEADDWSQWRGPSGQSIAADGNTIPTKFSPTQNVLWNAQIAGAGHSSPTVVGDLVVVTAADSAQQQQAILGFNRATGKPAFTTIVNEGGFPQIHGKNTHASPTVCSNGKLFCATFHHHDKIEAVAVDQAGKIVWRKNLGAFRPKQFRYGYAASPTLYNDQLIICADSDTGAWLTALDVNTGRVIWKTDRARSLNWASPIVANVAGRDQLLVSGGERIASYDPKNGKQLWQTRCLTMATCGTVTWDDDTVYASGGYPKKETVAVKADGSGTVVWRNRVKCYEQSMLVHDGYLYGFDDNGIIYCWHAKTGKEMWKQRLRGPVSASLCLVDGNIFACNEKGNVWVFRASAKGYQQVAQNQMGTSLFATPTIVDNVMYLRSASGEGRNRQEAIFAIGTK